VSSRAASSRPGSLVRGRAVGRGLRTVALYGLTMWAVVTLVFLLPRMMPGDPLSALNDPDSDTYVYDEQSRARVAAYYGLDQPLIVQYTTYLSDLAQGDLGWSISQSAPVSRLIAARLPWTLLLMGSAVIISSIISFGLGVTAGWRRGGRLDRTLIVSSSVSRAIPEYAMASLLLIAFAVIVPIFPQAGAMTPFARHASPIAAAGDIARHLVLPLTALSLGLLGNKFLLVRNSVIGTLGEDYMLLARAKGLPPHRLKYLHSGRNILLPFLTVLGIQLAFAAGGSLFVEAVFAYPGMGTLVNAAVTARDYPLLQGTFLVLALVVLVANLLVELAYGAVDPRVTR
jgi:peptide/nickel transport system permease protein